MIYRKDLINYFIEKYEYQHYLEIGVKHPSKTFDHIQCIYKEGVDPNGCTTHNMTSDQFFKELSINKKWDIIFIDGLHERTQVFKDINNALLHLNNNGTIVCHDVNPLEEWLLSNNACWNAWEAFAELRSTRTDIVMYTLPIDHIGFIQFGNQDLYQFPIEYTFDYLNTHRTKLMNQLTLEEFYIKFPKNK